MIVATLSKAYYVSAINLANSILDFYPEAKITLFTEPELFDERHRKLFDIIDLSTPHHKRGKLFALPRTPYDITAYIDADCEVRDEEISNIFDQLGDNDIVLTKIRDYSGADLSISDTETMYWHCGVFVYNNKKKTIQMMQDWWAEYDLQISSPEWLWPQHHEAMRPWDQYTFYRLYTSKKYKTIKLGVFPGEDARWNYVFNYRPEEITKDPIIFHYTLSSLSVHAGNINKK